MCKCAYYCMGKTNQQIKTIFSCPGCHFDLKMSWYPWTQKQDFKRYSHVSWENPMRLFCCDSSPKSSEIKLCNYKFLWRSRCTVAVDFRPLWVSLSCYLTFPPRSLLSRIELGSIHCTTDSPFHHSKRLYCRQMKICFTSTPKTSSEISGWSFVCG